MPRFVRLDLLAALLILSSPAAAQDIPQNQEASEIVVTGSRDRESQVRDFVKALTEAPATGQISRFEWTVCPAAIGLPQQQKEAVANRMRRIAAAVDIPLGKPSCTPNVVLAVTADKAAFIETLRQLYPSAFGDMSSAQIRRLAREAGPAAAWHIQGPPLDTDGVEIPMALVNDREVYLNRTMRAQSRMTAASRPHFKAAFVVVESSALKGLTVKQAADYAAMRAFANTNPHKLAGSSVPTILNILDAPMNSQVPITMTEWDLAFLRALYASPLNLYAGANRAGIARHVSKEVQQPPNPKE